MSVPESRARLGYLLSEMLALPYLPEDLHQAVTAHLQQQLSVVNLLNPEYCLRLYQVLAELADLKAKSEAVPTQTETFSVEIHEEPESEAGLGVQSVAVAAEASSEAVTADTAVEEPSVASEEVAVETSAEAMAQEDESAEGFVENMPMAAIAETANAGVNPRTLW